MTIQWTSRIAIVITAIAVVTLLWGIWWLWWRLPQRYVARLTPKIEDPKSRVDIEDNFRKTIGQALGGAAVLIGAGAAYYGTQQSLRVNEVQARLSQQSSHDLLVGTQISKGFDQLGSDNKAVQLGGIYVLEGVMNGSDQYQQSVLEALCAFVRDSTASKSNDDAPAVDIQAALTVIGRRQGGRGEVNLAGAKIPKADLRNARLRGADLTDAGLAGANLARADLRGTRLLRTDMRGAELNNTNLSPDDSSLEIISSSQLIGADLSRAALLNTNLVNALLHGTNFKGATLFGADLSGAKLDGQAQLDGACGTDAKLPGDLTLRPCLAPSSPPLLDTKATP